MQYRNDKSGASLSILGYGCMRFSRKGGAIDIDKAEINKNIRVDASLVGDLKTALKDLSRSR